VEGGGEEVEGEGGGKSKTEVRKKKSAPRSDRQNIIPRVTQRVSKGEKKKDFLVGGGAGFGGKKEA